MAEEEINDKPQDTTTDAAPAAGMAADTGTGKSKKVLLFVVLPLILIIGLGAGAYFFGALEKHVPDCAAAKTDEHKDFAECEEIRAAEAARPVHFIEVPDIIVNLNSPARQPRFLKISLKMELDSDLDRQTMEKLLPRVVDQFQAYLRELRVEDLRGSSGIYRLKIELLNRVRAAAPNVGVRDVLFQEILVQ